MLTKLNHYVNQTKHYLEHNVHMTKQTRSGRMLELLADFGMNKAELARGIGVSRATITNWANDEAIEIKGKHLQKIEQKYGINGKWFERGVGDKYIKIESSIESAPNIGSHVPLISSVQAGGWTEAVDPYSVGDYEKLIATTANVSSNAFALRVIGDSMTAPYGKSIPEGMIVIVDPNIEAVNGKIVIAKLDDNNEATIKKLVIEGNSRHLLPLNPRHPIIPINGNCHIIGVVVKGEIDL